LTKLNNSERKTLDIPRGNCGVFSLEPPKQDPRNEIMDLCRVNPSSSPLFCTTRILKLLL